jgi:mannose-6-phosphate isomerase-like protein (cupin superfamily)
MEGRVRRVVTGHDKRGRAIVVSDAQPPSYCSRPGHFRTEVWATETTPAVIGGDADPDRRTHVLPPPANGTAFKIVDFPPDALAARPASGASDILSSVSTAKPGVHPGMHRTETVDYCIVLEGEVFLVLDESEVLLQQGDVVIQCGTNHAWSNRSSHSCRLAFFMIDGQFEPGLARVIKASSSA